jgi:rubrerythrin
MNSEQRSGTEGRESAAAATAAGGRALSRKQALLVIGGGVIGASGGALAGCASERPATGEEGRGDVEALNYALKLEHSGVVVYESGADLPDPQVRDIARRFAEQAVERVATLSELVEARGGTPRAPEPNEEFLEEANLAQVEDEAGFISVAVDLENTAIAGYTDLVTELSELELRRVVYGLAANSAAHVSVLLGAAGEVQVPDALVTGQPG